jgi:exosortase/archaeosortase family protein
MDDARSCRAITILLGLMYPAIWLLDTGWWQMSADVVIIVGLLPFVYWMAAKNPANSQLIPVNVAWVYLAAACLATGVILNLMSLMAFGWAGLAAIYCFPRRAISKLRLWVLCAGAFPWVLLDLNTLSWWFRLSGAWLTGAVFDVVGMDVLVRGTQLEIDGLPISVEAACGGLQVLQVLISGGIALTLLKFPSERLFWVMLALLPLVAWIANTARIILISGWGLVFGAESAAGAFHTWGAILVVALMLGLYHALSESLQRTIYTKEIRDA